MITKDQVQQVKDLMKKGMNAKEALKKLKINRATFYRYVTEAEVLEMNQIKASFAVRGIKGARKGY